MTTIHKYFEECEPDVKYEFYKAIEKTCPDGYEPVLSMNEYYVTSRNPKGSDIVFETPHVDGPWGFLPFTLLRCVYVLKEDPNVITCIPSQNYCDSIKKDEYVLFDYNRDVHYIIYQDVPNDRIVLKLHYVKIQFLYKIFKLLNILWNSFARNLFLYSKSPETVTEKCVAWIINKVTSLYAPSSNLSDI